MNPAHAKELLIENLKRENCYQKGNTPEDFSTNMVICYFKLNSLLFYCKNVK